MKLSCCVAQNVERFERLQALEPSASTLIVIVHFMLEKPAEFNEKLREVLKEFAGKHP